MKKIGFFVLLSVLTFSAFGQQFLWSTVKKDGEKQVPINRVTEEVLKFYDHYKLYYDYTGYNKKRFIEEIAEGFDDMEDLNDITGLTIYAGKSNNGYGSYVLIACISEENVDMIVFSNTPIEGDLSFQSTGLYDRERFVRWFKTLMHEAGDANALYPGSSSQGNTDNTTGDAGDPSGTVDSRALYGKSGGGGGGPSLDLAGWRWDYEPRPNDSSRENGRIVFEIKVDENGKLIGVRTLEKTVSPSVEQLYRQEVEKLSFSPLSGNTIPAPISTGKITFIITSK